MLLNVHPLLGFTALNTQTPLKHSKYDIYPLITAIGIWVYLWCAFKLMCILIPKYNDMKFGGGVKVFTMNIRGAGHSV